MVKLKYTKACLPKITYGSYLLKACRYITIIVDGVITSIILLMTKIIFIDSPPN